MEGHIEIKDEIIFVYHKLPAPKTINYFSISTYNHAWHEYGESERQIKVDNVYHNVITEEWILTGEKWNHLDIEIKGNTECEIEIIDNKAIIIKILYQP